MSSDTAAEANDPQPDERPADAASDVDAWVLDTVDDTLQLKDDLWSSRSHVLQEAVKTTVGHEKAAVREAIQRAIANDDLFHWHGLLAPADPDHLRAIIEYEQQADITRKLMVGEINKLLARLNGGESR